MWIFFNDGFVSAVQDRAGSDRLCVRAREAEHLKGLFPGTELIGTPDADYAWRVFVTKQEFADVVCERIADLGYSNFKASVRDDRLHDLYLSIWSECRSYQTRPIP